MRKKGLYLFLFCLLSGIVFCSHISVKRQAEALMLSALEVYQKGDAARAGELLRQAGRKLSCLRGIVPADSVELSDPVFRASGRYPRLARAGCEMACGRAAAKKSGYGAAIPLTLAGNGL